jgi:hypothetical protein
MCLSELFITSTARRFTLAKAAIQSAYNLNIGNLRDNGR